DYTFVLVNYFIFISIVYSFILFFFSSRRRHTRFSRDWSSDVCSSDLAPADPLLCYCCDDAAVYDQRSGGIVTLRDAILSLIEVRSEERRVGKECRSWGARDP